MRWKSHIAIKYSDRVAKLQKRRAARAGGRVKYVELRERNNQIVGDYCTTIGYGKTSTQRRGGEKYIVEKLCSKKGIRQTLETTEGKRY